MTNEDIIKSYIPDNENQILTLLISKNQGIIHTIAKSGMPQIPLEDKLAACHIGLLRAIRTYDETRGAKLVTYAHWLMRQEIKKLNMQTFSWAYQDGVDAPIEAQIDTDIEEEMAEMADTREKTPEESLQHEELQDIIEQNLHGLKEKNVEIFCHYYGIFSREEMTSYEIAERFHVSRQYVNQTVDATRSILEARLKKRYQKDNL